MYALRAIIGTLLIKIGVNRRSDSMLADIRDTLLLTFTLSTIAVMLIVY